MALATNVSRACRSKLDVRRLRRELDGLPVGLEITPVPGQSIQRERQPARKGRRAQPCNQLRFARVTQRQEQRRKAGLGSISGFATSFGLAADARGQRQVAIEPLPVQDVERSEE